MPETLPAPAYISALSSGPSDTVVVNAELPARIHYPVNLVLDSRGNDADASAGDPVSALVDSGADLNAIDLAFAKRMGITLIPLARPIPLFVADGRSPGAFTHTAQIRARFDRFDETLTFHATHLGPAPLILGMPWLQQFDPNISWRHQRITSFPQSANSGPSPAASVPPLDSAEISVAEVSPGQFFRLMQRHRYGSLLASMKVHGAAGAAPSDPLGAVPAEFHDYADVFTDRGTESLPPHRPFDHRIDLEEGKHPPFGPIYKLAPVELEALRNYLQENLASGFIRPSQSPAGAPILFVKKKDGSLRLCVDFRGLNRVTRKNRYPLPLIPELVDRLGKARYFSKIDLRNAYYQVRIREGDEWKTAFRTRYGHFEYRVMPFGLTNAPATFQHLVNTTFTDMLDTCVVAYLDDILIYSETLEQHQSHIRQVLARLRKARLYARPKKCSFYARSVEFLGFIIDADGVRMDPEKLESIRSWPVPNSVRDVQSFLGFTNFYRQFIAGYSGIAAPLTGMTKSKIFEWTPEAQSAFETLKSAFESAGILRHADMDRPFLVETDASDFAGAAVLSQTFEDGLHPVAFFSRKFKGPELNYTVHDKEMLAIVWAFEHWRAHLEGGPHTVRVITDHQPLVYFNTKRALDRRQARWMEFLQRFDFVIEHRPGRMSGKPDALSRRADFELSAEDRAGMTHRLVHLSTVQVDRPSLHAEGREAMRSAQKGDSFTADRTREIAAGAAADGYAVSDGLLTWKGRLYVPDCGSLRLRILQDCHDRPLAGHPSRAKTLAAVSRYFYWPRMSEFVAKFVRSCETCARTKPRRHAPYGFLQPLPLADRPWRSVSADFIVFLPRSRGFDAILVIVDRFSKMAKFEPCTSGCSAEDFAERFVRRVVASHGFPADLVTDRGPQFSSAFWRSLASRIGLELRFSTAYHPQTDGQTERVNQWLEQYLRTYCNHRQDDWADLLPLAEFAYNSATHASTGVSPFFACYGFDPPAGAEALPAGDDARLKNPDAAVVADRMKSIHATLRTMLSEAQTEQARQYDRGRSAPPAFDVGDRVWLSTRHLHSDRPSSKLDVRYLGPYSISEKISDLAFRLDLPADSQIHDVVNITQLEPYHAPAAEVARDAPPAPIIAEDGVEEYEVEEVVDSFSDFRCNPPYRYIVKYVGYPEPEVAIPENLANCAALVEEFHARHPERPGPHHDPPISAPRRRGRRRL